MSRAFPGQIRNTRRLLSIVRSATSPRNTDEEGTCAAVRRFFDYSQEVILFVVLLLVCGIAFSRNQPDPDFWGHVRYGQDMLADGLTEATTYSYLADPHYPWINHEIISELLLAVGIGTVGPSGLLGIKCALGVAIVGFLLRRASRLGVSITTLGLLSLLTALNLMYFWQLRPQLPTFVCFAILLALLDRAFGSMPGEADGRSRWLWLIPPLMAFWANCHGGFVAGLAVLAAFLSVRVVEARVREGAMPWGMAGRFLLVLIVSTLATALNPYGFRLHAFLWDDLVHPRPEILEWRRPDLFNGVWLPWWLLVVVFLAAAFHDRRRLGWAETAVLFATLWQSIEHYRNIPFFVLAFAFWMPMSLDRLLSRGRREEQPAPRAVRFPWAIGAAFLACGALLAGLLYRQLAVMPVMRSVYPVTAFQYMADEQLRGRLVVRFMWAQYCLAAFGDPDPQCNAMPVAFDGRFRTCYPQETVDSYFDFHLGNAPDEPRFRSSASPPFDGKRILEMGNPDLVLFGRNQPHPVALLRSLRPEWVLLYQDQISQLWGRAARYDDPFSPDYLPPDRRRIGDQCQVGYVPWPAFPRAKRSAGDAS